MSVVDLLQLVVGLGLLNVWLLRQGSATAYRGGASRTLKAEFEAYGLPSFMFYVVGALKVVAALVLIAGIWIALPVRAAALVVAVLMVGALVMHLRVGDPPLKSLPAALMLAMSAAIAILHPAALA